MQRIYYGAMTFDVANELADLLIEATVTLSESYFSRSARIGGGWGTQAFAVGRTERVLVAARMEGRDVTMDIVLGPGIPIASVDIEDGDDPLGTADAIESVRDVIGQHQTLDD